MVNHYEILDVEQDAPLREIKRAFREKVKRLHPDITGSATSPEMRRLLDAYEVLSNRERRFQYDRMFRPASRAARRESFDYRSFLKEKLSKTDKKSAVPESHQKYDREPPQGYYEAQLILFDLLHFEEEDAVAVWQAAGGIDFPLKQFLNREDWMDYGFLLAEELERHDYIYEAFLLAAQLLAEERKQPYFRHFALDVELFLKELARYRLRRAVSPELWIHSLKTLLGLGFPAKDEARWFIQLASALQKTGDKADAVNAVMEAKKRDAKIAVPRKVAAL